MSFETALAGSPPAPESDAGQGAETGVGTPQDPGTVNPGGGQRQSESVPYDRFQPINEVYQALKQEAAEYGYDDPREYARALREAYNELSAAQAKPAEDAVDPELSQIRQQVQLVSNTLAEQEFRRQFDTLKAEFPEVDEQQVRWGLTSGQYRDLRTAMHASHVHEEKKRQDWLARREQFREERNNAGVEGSGGGMASGGVDYSKMSTADFQKAVARAKGLA